MTHVAIKKVNTIYIIYVMINMLIYILYILYTIKRRTEHHHLSVYVGPFLRLLFFCVLELGTYPGENIPSSPKHRGSMWKVCSRHDVDIGIDS